MSLCTPKCPELPHTSRIISILSKTNMHCLYFVKLKRERAESAEEAISEAVGELDNNSFCGAGGYFSGSKGDSYVIGGRWSGTLHELKHNFSFRDEAAAAFSLDASEPPSTTW